MNKSYTVIDRSNRNPVEQIHEESVKCTDCGEPLSLQNYYLYDGKPYCEKHCPNLDTATEVT